MSHPNFNATPVSWAIEACIQRWDVGFLVFLSLRSGIVGSWHRMFSKLFPSLTGFAWLGFCLYYLIQTLYQWVSAWSMHQTQLRALTTQITSSTPQSFRFSRICISNELPGDLDAAGPRATLWEAVLELFLSLEPFPECQPLWLVLSSPLAWTLTLTLERSWPWSWFGVIIKIISLTQSQDPCWLTLRPLLRHHISMVMNLEKDKIFHTF